MTVPRLSSLFCAIALLASLSACFVQHHDLIGTAEPVPGRQWSGAWVAEPLSEGDEPGYFRVTDVDPAQGVFQVQDADANGAAMGEPMELHLRRVGDRLFLDVRDKADRPWMLFVVDEATPERISLAWKPAAKAFQDSIDRGDFKATITTASDGHVEEIAMSELTSAQADTLATHWRDLFTEQRVVLTRMVDAD